MKFFCFLLIIFILISCGQQNHQDINTLSTDTSIQDSQILDSNNQNSNEFATLTLTIDSSYPCQLSNPDTSIFNVILGDRESSIKQLGGEFHLREDDDLPFEKFCSYNKLQTVTFFFHPGDYKNQFSEFQVAYYSYKDSAVKLNTEKFVTEKGIELGFSKQQVISIFGKCFKTLKLKKKSEIIKYKLDDFNHSAFLQRYNMPIYYAEYEFKNDKLVRFRFGFEYP